MLGAVALDLYFRLHPKMSSRAAVGQCYNPTLPVPVGVTSASLGMQVERMQRFAGDEAGIAVFFVSLRDLLRLPKALYVALLNALDARLSTSLSAKTLLDIYRKRLWTHSSAGTGEATTVCK